MTPIRQRRRKMLLRRMDRRRVATAIALAFACFAFTSNYALTQEVLAIVPARYVEDIPPPEPFAGNLVQTTFGLRTWVSTGHSAVSYGGIDGIPHVMSELQ